MSVTMNGPLAHSTCEKETPIVCIAGGSGLAPIKAILEGGGMIRSKEMSYFYLSKNSERFIFPQRD